MGFQRYPKTLVAAAICFSALVAALPSAGGHLSQAKRDRGAAARQVMCVETRGGPETKGDLKVRRRRCAPG